MGMFDDLRCKYPLPVEGANDLSYQTKDTPNQYLDLYEIRENGTLWHEEYDIEDRSDPNAKGLMALKGCMTRVNKRWVQDTTFTGELCFYASLRDIDGGGGGWIEWSSYFVAGKLNQIHLLEHRPSTEERHTEG